MTDRILKPFPYTPAPQLVADVGGTNTRVALADHGVLRSGSIRRFSNAEHGALEDILVAYLNSNATPDCDGVCVAIAGAVRDGAATMANLDWEVSEDSLRQATGAESVALLNDLQAQGHALSTVDPRHITTLMRGAQAEDVGTQLVVGAGTGFNAAPVYHLPQGTFVAPSEHGHSHLPQGGEREQALARDLAQKHGIASIEEVLCGRGLVALHAWVTGETTDGPAIIEAIAQGHPQAVETGQLYARIMGHVLGSLALTTLPYGGIYLIGGVARAMAPHLVALGMKDAFFQMGRLSYLMEEFAVHVVADDYAALHGCASFLREHEA